MGDYFRSYAPVGEMSWFELISDPASTEGLLAFLLDIIVCELGIYLVKDFERGRPEIFRRLEIIPTPRERPNSDANCLVLSGTNVDPFLLT